jgi:hypothetical protein
MASAARTLAQVLAAQSDANIRFSDLRHLLARLGFTEGIRGGHFIYVRQGVAEIINLQPRGGKAKPYQVRQVRGLVMRYALTLEDGEE